MIAALSAPPTRAPVTSSTQPPSSLSSSSPSSSTSSTSSTSSAVPQAPQAPASQTSSAIQKELAKSSPSTSLFGQSYCTDVRGQIASPFSNSSRNQQQAPQSSVLNVSTLPAFPAHPLSTPTTAPNSINGHFPSLLSSSSTKLFTPISTVPTSKNSASLVSSPTYLFSKSQSYSTVPTPTNGPPPFDLPASASHASFTTNLSSGSPPSSATSTNHPPISSPVDKPLNFPIPQTSASVISLHNLPQNITIRELRLMFTFASDFVASDLSKENGRPIGWAYFKSVHSASIAKAYLESRADLLHFILYKQNGTSTQASSSPIKCEQHIIRNPHLPISNENTAMSSRVPLGSAPANSYQGPKAPVASKPSISRFTFQPTPSTELSPYEYFKDPSSTSLFSPRSPQSFCPNVAPVPAQPSAIAATSNSNSNSTSSTSTSTSSSSSSSAATAAAAPTLNRPAPDFDHNNIGYCATGKSLVLESEIKDDEGFEDLVSDPSHWLTRSNTHPESSSHLFIAPYHRPQSDTMTHFKPRDQAASIRRGSSETPRDALDRDQLLSGALLGSQKPYYYPTIHKSQDHELPDLLAQSLHNPNLFYRGSLPSNPVMPRTISTSSVGVIGMTGHTLSDTSRMYQDEPKQCDAASNQESTPSQSPTATRAVPSNDCVKSLDSASTTTNSEQRVFSGNNVPQYCGGTNAKIAWDKRRLSSANKQLGNLTLSSHIAAGSTPSLPLASTSAPGSTVTSPSSASPTVAGLAASTAATNAGVANAEKANRILPPANPADQNPPCNTLYVGNLPPDTSEDELKALFSACPGYKRLCFRTKANGPMCFVEFEDVARATRALEELYGVGLSNSVKGGIRLSFSKNPLGVRSNNSSNINNNSAAAAGSSSGGGGNSAGTSNSNNYNNSNAVNSQQSINNGNGRHRYYDN